LTRLAGIDGGIGSRVIWSRRDVAEITMIIESVYGWVFLVLIIIGLIVKFILPWGDGLTREARARANSIQHDIDERIDE